MLAKELSEFEHREELLALTLSLKENDSITTRGNEGKKHYRLLFNTYIKMLESDNNGFFVKTEDKQNIILSLKRTIDFREAKKPEAIKQMIDQLRNNDPTDFFIIPVSYRTSTKKASKHASSLLIYKKENKCVVTMIDKDRGFKKCFGSYVTIPSNQMSYFSEFLQETKSVSDFTKYFNRVEPYSLLKNIVALSNEKK